MPQAFSASATIRVWLGRCAFDNVAKAAFDSWMCPMQTTLPSLDDILKLDGDGVAHLVSELTRHHQLSQLVRDLNDRVLANGVDSAAGQALRHLGFLV
jgi:hypothetical protein